MSVNLSPSSTLGFNRPLTQNVKRALAISNPHAQPVAFKVKTTAPKLYCVRPNSGRVEPGETVEVQVMLQAMKEEPPLNAKCKDKFLIQSTLINPDKEVQDIWNISEGDDPNKIHSQKIKVAYLPAEGTAVEEEEEAPANVSSGLNGNHDAYGTVRQHPGDVTAEQSSILPRTSTPPADFSAAREEAHEEPSRPAPVAETPSGGVGVVNVNVHTPSPPTPPTVPISPPAPAPVDPNPELKAKYQEAQSEIQRLRALLAAVPDPSSVASSGTSPTELRRRHRPLSDDATTVVSSNASSYVEDGVLQPEGVPLQVVVIIALIVFITTYLFF
ncbi:VAMP-associated protein [Dentipellis sp. KUC8613]|nr:VAMP-associated protein [Dentipellis sp. KUC8613]